MSRSPASRDRDAATESDSESDAAFDNTNSADSGWRTDTESGWRTDTESDTQSDTCDVVSGVDPTAGRIKVGVSDLAVTADAETLTTSGLGSCVAVALADEHTGVRGLLHAMLPSEDGMRRETTRPAKYVDTGLETLITELRDAGADPHRLQARVAGGAEMLDLTDAVGPRNVEQVRTSLRQRNIPIVASDVGKTVGRTVRFRPDGHLTVRAADGFERTI